jgi:hypothetical protein
MFFGITVWQLDVIEDLNPYPDIFDLPDKKLESLANAWWIY